METRNLQTIAEYAGAHLRCGDPRRAVTGITTDSRQTEPDALFLALRGDRFDGHKFVEDSAAHGTAGAIVEHGFSLASLPHNYALLEVDDTLQAYQRLAASYRRALQLKVVAITGSNGKTSTKDFTAAVLASRFRTLKTEGNLNNHIGVPKTLLRATADDQMVVLEMGMNHPGEIEPLTKIAYPDVGIITNIGTAHIEFLGSRAGIAREKGMLAEAIGSEGYVILPAAGDYTAAIAARTTAKVILVGAADSLVSAEDVEPYLGGSRFTLIVDGERMRITLPIPGEHMVTNALLAVAAGIIHGVSLAECVTALSEAQLTKGRMELKHVRGLQILDDTYNANPDSMIAALKTLGQMPTSGRRIAVLGRMGELGAESDNGHRSVGATAAHEKIDYLIGVGADADFIIKGARDAGLRQVLTVADTDEAAAWLNANAIKGDSILLKGSRSAAMERVLFLIEPHQSSKLSPPSALAEVS